MELCCFVADLAIIFLSIGILVRYLNFSFMKGFAEASPQIVEKFVSIRLLSSAIDWLFPHIDHRLSYQIKNKSI